MVYSIISERRLKVRNTKDYAEWCTWIASAPKEVFEDTLRYYANKRVNYNKGIITLDKKDLLELLSFQRAAASVGIDRKKFNSYVNV